MAYHLLNIETYEYYYCDDAVWISAIDYAKKNGWKPDGTFFDYIYVAEEECFDIDDEMYFLYLQIISKHEYDEWDGNYIEKRNQIVMYEDTIYLGYALEGSGITDDLLEFIKKGSFRICS